MPEKKKGNIASKVAELVKEAVEECGCTLWDVEFVKEGSDYNLIIYIDKPDGVSLVDCEMVNDAVNPILDREDPIDTSYCLEVSSPGLERELKTAEHIKAFVGERVIVKFYAPRDGRKACDAIIEAFDEETGILSLTVGDEKLSVDLKDCASIKTVCDF